MAILYKMKKIKKKTKLKNQKQYKYYITMGQIFSGLLNRLWGSKEVRILILGLDGKIHQDN